MSGKSLVLGPQDVYEFITTAMAVRRVPFIAGPPGIGKSQVVHQVAKDAGAKVIDLRLSQMLSEDLTGIPERDEKTGKAYYMPFDVFPLEGDSLPENYNGWILFLDELTSAQDEVLAAAYSLILDRTVGGRKLHPKCLVVAAGNRQSDSAIARALPDTLITRMLPCEMLPNVKDWLYWAKKNKKSNEAVVDFIKNHPTSLYNPTAKDNRDENESFATPRGWEVVFALVNHHEKRIAQKALEDPPTDSAGIPIKQDPGHKLMAPLDDMTINLVGAAIGPLAAREFSDVYDAALKVAYPWEIAQAPASARIPGTAVARARLTTDITEYFVKSDDATRDAVLIFMNRMDEEYRELFCSTLKGFVTDRASDISLVDSVHDRLNIDPLFGGKKGGDPDGSNDPFPQ